MNKEYQKEQLRKIILDPDIHSGLYLLDTDLSDEDIDNYLTENNVCTYIHETLIPTSEGSSFELLVIGLSYRCSGTKIDIHRDRFMVLEGRAKENVLFSLLILILRELCVGKQSVVHIKGPQDLASLSDEDLNKLKAALPHHESKTLIISKKKNTRELPENSLIKYISLPEKIKFRLMENKLENVHISYKHDKAYTFEIEVIKNSLKHNNIPFSIDEYDIMYRSSIPEYEKEIGISERIIMVVIPNYLKSIDCMFEMTEMLKNGRIRERIFPLVDLGAIPRNADGLEQIKNYWTQEKEDMVAKINNDKGKPKYFTQELEKIQAILESLDDFWDYIVHYNTCDVESLLANDAAMLIEELKKTLPAVKAPVGEKFIPTDATKPAGFKTVTQNGEKSIYIEKNEGNITIS